MELDLAGITEKVKTLPHKRAFFRWATVCIEIAQLPKENYEQVGNFRVFEYTAESKQEIRHFVELATTAFNNTHDLSQTVHAQEVLEEICRIWADDEKDFQRQQVIPK